MRDDFTKHAALIYTRSEFFLFPSLEMVIAWSVLWLLRLTLSSIRVRLLCTTEIFDKSLNHATVVFWCSYTAILFVVWILSFLWPVQIQSESTWVEMCSCGWMNIALAPPFFYCSPIFDLSLKMGVGFLSTCYSDLSFLLSVQAEVFYVPSLSGVQKPFCLLDWSPVHPAVTCHDSNCIISAVCVCGRVIQMMLSGGAVHH